jgi:hypothetical protein
MQRELLGRMVRYLLGQGIRQFLDLGSGLPVLGHVHEIAAGTCPPSRVVYVDRDPDVVAESRKLLLGEDHVAVLRADIREPDVLLDAVRDQGLLNLDEPVAVLVIGMLQHVPDLDRPVELITAYRNAICPGSYLGLSHYGPDSQLTAAFQLFDQMQLGRRPDVSLRDKIELARFFAGFELVEPGIVPIVAWRPGPDDELGHRWERLPVHGGLGRKR